MSMWRIAGAVAAVASVVLVDAAMGQQQGPRGAGRRGAQREWAATTRAAVGRPEDPVPPLVIPEVARDQVIGFCLYTVQDGVMKMTAQLYPLKEGEERRVALEVERDGKWEKAGEAEVEETGWAAVFRVEGWDQTKDHKYRVTHAGGARYEGLIRRDPREKDEIVVAVFTGNSNKDRGPRPDIIANIKAQDPDLLFFSGDQVYDHQGHTASWLIFGRQFQEVMRDRPTITIPDDHDVGQSNLWGAGGTTRPSSQAGNEGGYFRDVRYVRMVERAQASHLPDPVDPTPLPNGVGVYYTAMDLGGVSFAILEDRKWKSGPKGLVPQMGPRPDHVTDPKLDPKTIDVPGAELLGERQLKFLRQWGQDWSGGAEFKAVLSQTIFAGASHLSGNVNQRVVADLDSNGWPQSGRDAALREMRKSFAVHLAGDQHLGTVIHHGVDAWEDAGVSFCVPSIVNFYGRWWDPVEEPENHDPKNPLPETGRYRDGFGNRITMMAYANPTNDNHKAAGYGIVRFRKSDRTITLECWPRMVDVTNPDAKQFAGWPITVRQEDNYGRKAAGYLPTIKVVGREDAVMQVVEEGSGEVVYTVRINGTEYRPKVFKAGTYTVHVGEGEERRTVKGLRMGEDRVVEVRVGGG